MTDMDHLNMNGILKEIRVGTRMEAAGVERTQQIPSVLLVFLLMANVNLVT